MFLIYELFLGLSSGEEIFVFGKCYGFTHDHPWIEPPRRSFFTPSFLLQRAETSGARDNSRQAVSLPQVSPMYVLVLQP
jgi:hypothetical protein